MEEQIAALGAEAAELELDEDPKMKEELLEMVERIRREHGFEPSSQTEFRV